MLHLLLWIAPLAAAGEFDVVRDITYATYQETSLRLDLYLPKGSSGRVPGVIVIRGGGWRMGDKNGFARIAQYLAAEGFAAACIEYRVLPANRFPAFAHDAKAAVRWMRANAKRYGIDPQSIGAIGGSAGGHLVALLGSSFKTKELEGSGGNTRTSSRVQAVVAMAPVVDLRAFGDRDEFFDPALPKNDRVRLASPISFVDKDSAPFLLLHGGADRTVPVAQSESMQTRLRDAGVDAELHIYPKAPHAFWNSDQFEDSMRRAASFFRARLSH